MTLYHLLIQINSTEIGFSAFLLTIRDKYGIFYKGEYMDTNFNRQLAYMQYINRENSKVHHGYDEEMLQYHYIKAGDERAVTEAEKMMYSNGIGHLSDDELRNAKYLFVCSVTLATRFAIEGGMNPEKAYSASDLYIQKADNLKNTKDVYSLHGDMIKYYVSEVATVKKSQIYSKPIVICIDYIYSHLHQSIGNAELAAVCKINQNYLSTLFRQETGMKLSDFIMMKKIETAQNMLTFSDFELSEISEILNFSSYSHFARIFRKYCSMTPKQYRNLTFRNSMPESNTNY